MTLLLQFQRYECKYLVTERQAATIRKLIAPWVEPDPYAAGRPGLSYPIASLYLDSPTLKLYRETLEGQRSRFKLRIRAYSEDEREPVFFEIKRRHNMVVRKARGVAPRGEMRRFLWGGGIDLEGCAERGRDALSDFCGKVERTNSLPVVTVCYDREAYMGLFDGKTRVTFDRNIRCRPPATGGPVFDATDWAPIEGRKVVLEMKFDGRLPHWMQSVIHKCELQRTSYSKYSRSVARLGAGLLRSNMAGY